MTKATLLTLFILFTFQVLNSQNVICGYDLVVEQMEKKYPGYRKSIDKTFQDAKANSSHAHSGSMTYNIPVVVHVVWNEDEEKIGDSLITSQIEVLNQDFQRLNSDADSVRNIFKDIVASPMISFSLEEIIYVETETLFEIDLFSNELPDIIKETDNGGSDPWNVERYLNIWICKIQPITFGGQNLGQLLGYAYPPNDLDNWPAEFQNPNPNYDGVVLDYRVVGLNNPYTVDPGLGEEIQFAKGRSAVHEVGHYLGLRHIWGDGNGFSQNTCDFDDGIEDTPNAGSQTLFICDTLKNTCSASINDLPDMIENYMDYSSEDCQNSFTKGQVALMRSVLENQRCQLVEVIPDCSVSTRQLEEVNIDIHPNPSTGLFYINASQLDLYAFQIEVYDASGKKYLMDLKDNSLDLSKFPKGVFFLRGINEQQVFQQKLIKH